MPLELSVLRAGSDVHTHGLQRLRMSHSPHRGRALACFTLGLALTLVMAVIAPRAHAGPWVPEPGHGYVKLWFKYLYGFDYHRGDGTTAAYGAYHEAFFAGYAELGVAERVGLVLHSDVLRSFHLEDPSDGSYTSHFGPGDPYLGVRVQLLSIDRFALGVEAGARLPFARATPVTDVIASTEGNPAIAGLRTGTGVVDVPLTLSAGYGGDGWYAAASAGYVMRTEGWDHALTWSAEAGFNLSDANLAFRGRLVGFHSLGYGFEPRAEGTDSPSGYNNGAGYVGFALEADYAFEPRWFVGLTVEGGLGYIHRQTGGPVVSLYLATSF